MCLHSVSKESSSFGQPLPFANVSITVLGEALEAVTIKELLTSIISSYFLGIVVAAYEQ